MKVVKVEDISSISKLEKYNNKGFIFKTKDENYTYYYTKLNEMISVGSNGVEEDISQYWTYFFLYDSGLN